MILIACRIFEDELKLSLPEDDSVEVFWMDAALHTDLHRLEAAIRTALAKISKNNREIRLLYGNGCLPGIDALLRESGVLRSPVENCIEAFLGPKKKDLEKNRTMIMTPGWVRAWPEIMKALGWDEVDVRINLGRYERILLLDCGVHPLSDEEVLWFFDLAQIPIEIEPLDLGHFKKMLAQLLA